MSVNENVRNMHKSDHVYIFPLLLIPPQDRQCNPVITDYS